MEKTRKIYGNYHWVIGLSVLLLEKFVMVTSNRASAEITRVYNKLGNDVRKVHVVLRLLTVES